jgi:hypothetical protein
VLQTVDSNSEIMGRQSSLYGETYKIKPYVPKENEKAGKKGDCHVSCLPGVGFCYLRALLSALG